MGTGLNRKILIYDRVANDHIPRWLSGLVTYLEDKHYTVETMSGVCNGKIEQYSHIFMWNGELPIHRPLKRFAKKYSIPTTIVEVGFFPQSKYYVLDTQGINATSSLMDDNLDWITEEHLIAMQEFAAQYAGHRGKEEGEYVLCPLQLESDTNIMNNSPYKRMQQFIDHVEDRFKGEDIVFKTHPLQCNVQYRTEHKIVRQGNFCDMAMKAKLVYGINSTCLLEAALLGVPVTGIGDGLIKRHSDKTDKLLAAIIDKQMLVGDTNLDYWVQPLLKGLT